MRQRRVLRTAQAADYLGLARATLEKMRHLGTGPRWVRLGGRAVGYRIEDLDRWLDEECESSADKTD